MIQSWSLAFKVVFININILEDVVFFFDPLKQCYKKKSLRSREIAPQLRPLVLPEDQGLIPSTYMTTHEYLQLIPGDMIPSSHLQCVQMYIQANHPNIQF